MAKPIGSMGKNLKPRSEIRCLGFDARGNGTNIYISPTLTGDHQNRITDYTAIVVIEVDDGSDRSRFLQPDNNRDCVKGVDLGCDGQ